MVAQSTAVSPIAAKRLAIFNNMTAETQAVAKRGVNRFKNMAKGDILIYYKTGQDINAINESDIKYGLQAVKELAEFWGVPGGADQLYDLRDMVRVFPDPAFIEQQTSLEMADGRHMHTEHWIQLSKVTDKKVRLGLLADIREQSMSVSDLRAVVQSGNLNTRPANRQGGRKPKHPASPVIGMQKTFERAQNLNNYFKVATETALPALAGYDEDKVTPQLLEAMDKTHKILVETAENANTFIADLVTVRRKVQKTLDAKYEKSTAALEEGEAAASNGDGQAARPRSGGTAKRKNKAKDKAKDKAKKKAGNRRPAVAV